MSEVSPVEEKAVPQLLAEFVTAEDLAEALGVTKLTIQRWGNEKGMPTIKLGTRAYFHLPNVAKWLLSQETVKAVEG
jgi:excisionase family DNA binding protein